MDLVHKMGQFGVSTVVLLAMGCSDLPTDPDLLTAPRLEISGSSFTTADTVTILLINDTSTRVAFSGRCHEIQQLQRRNFLRWEGVDIPLVCPAIQPVLAPGDTTVRIELASHLGPGRYRVFTGAWTFQGELNRQWELTSSEFFITAE